MYNRPPGVMKKHKHKKYFINFTFLKQQKSKLSSKTKSTFEEYFPTFRWCNRSQNRRIGNVLLMKVTRKDFEL